MNLALFYRTSLVIIALSGFSSQIGNYLTGTQNKIHLEINEQGWY
jgi:hypothetical protein